MSSYHDNHQHGVVKKALVGALIITFLYMIAEFIGGYLSGSLALVTDAVHMLTDSASLVFSVIISWIATRPKSPRMSYGYSRAEVLGALISGLAIWLLAGFLIYEAIGRFGNPSPVDGVMVIGISLVGLIVNISVLKILHSGKGHSLNVRAAYLHVMSDILGSVAALVSGIVIWQTSWYLIDPILTFVICALILRASYKLVTNAIEILMERAPSHISPSDVQKELLALAPVNAVHDLHIWSMGSGKVALSVHLVSTEMSEALQEADVMLYRKFDIAHTTIQVEDPAKYKPEKWHDCS